MSSLTSPTGPSLSMQGQIRELSAQCQQMGMAGERAAGDGGVCEQGALPDLGVGAPKRMV